MNYQKTMCAVLFVILFSGAALAQHNQTWECQLIRDIGAQMSSGIDPERGDIILYSTEFERDDLGIWEDFDAFFSWISQEQYRQAGESFLDQAWHRALQGLPLGMIRQAYENYFLGGSVDCPDIEGANWSTPEEAQQLFSDIRSEISRRGQLRPDHPDFLSDIQYGPCGSGGPTAPKLRLVHISRPVFDEFGWQALIISDHSASVYERHSGVWTRKATYISIFC